MIDSYINGEVRRTSPEAPVPVVRVNETFNVLGGAANVARNLIGLESIPVVVGVKGRDSNGNVLDSLFEEMKIENVLIEIDSPTITKTRVIGNNQQIVRIDYEDELIKLTAHNMETLLETLNRLIPECEIIVISDYGKGICTPEICQFIINHSQKWGKKVIIDPKGKKWDKYLGAYLITPNIKELSDIAGCEIMNDANAITPVAKALRMKYDLQNILVTRSEKGMSLITENENNDIPTKAVTVFDVSGAGDTVVSVVAAAICGGLSLIDGISIANTAASIVIKKMGTQPILLNELELPDFASDKKVSIKSLPSLIDDLRNRRKKIVFTNGCFDILHRGHVEYLSKAKELGDVLILGLNSDESISRLKGPDRPINNLEDRCKVLEALSVVDYIVIFEDDTPIDIIKYIRPDVLVKGADYQKEDVVGRQFAGSVELIPVVAGRSTTSIIDKLKERH